MSFAEEADTKQLEGVVDKKEFNSLLQQELDLVAKWFQEGKFSNYPNQIGYEIELLMLKPDFTPLHRNIEFLKEFNIPFLSTETNKAQLEFSTDHFLLNQDVFRETEFHFNTLLEAIYSQEKDFSCKFLLMGTYPQKTPTLGKKIELTEAKRYQALDEALREHRNGKSAKFQITGKDPLDLEVESLSLNGLCSSFHIHLRVRQEEAKEFYNAAQIIAGPVLAACTNSPYFYGKELWAETRIPIFEQGVYVPGESGSLPLFGDHYVKESLFELFEENKAIFPHVLQFANSSSPKEHLFHFREQNSVSYRWNRPRVDFDHYGTPHLRIEYRALPIGPTIADMIANAALYIGAVIEFAHDPFTIPFEAAKKNFYEAAKHGLNATFHFPKEEEVQKILLERIIPAARKGLARLNITEKDIESKMKIIEERVSSKQNGTNWQKKMIERNGKNFSHMLEEYYHRQRKGDPVHTWSL